MIHRLCQVIAVIGKVGCALVCQMALVDLTAPSFLFGQTMSGGSVDIEAEPFCYSETDPNNRVSRLIDRIQTGETRLKPDFQNGYLASLLDELEIPVSTQTLVFSKTSLQVRYISRRNPRAIYFNDDTYVGWVRGSPIMEISTFDPKLGAAFYTVNSQPNHIGGSSKLKHLPQISQATYDCLSCHATSMSQGVPGHVVRSVVPEFDGSIAAQRESFVTDHTSPLEQRWGGWYVTGRHGDMHHMGNAYLRGGQLDTSRNGNRLNLRDEFDTYDYLSPYSDIVALMVLEHQTQMHNTLTRAEFAYRKHVFEMNQTPKSSLSDEELAEQAAELRLLAREVVDALLFHNETELESPVKGSILFANEFVSLAKTDTQGRSLREFDLETRMFKYPCSYLIHSDAFASLQGPLKEAVLEELRSILVSEVDSKRYPSLNAENRKVILAILQQTEPKLTESW